MTELTFRERMIATQPMIEPDMAIATALMGCIQPEYAKDPFASTAWYNEARALFHVRRIDAVIAASQIGEITCKATMQVSASEDGQSIMTVMALETYHDEA